MRQSQTHPALAQIITTQELISRVLINARATCADVEANCFPEGEMDVENPA